MFRKRRRYMVSWVTAHRKDILYVSKYSTSPLSHFVSLAFETNIKLYRKVHNAIFFYFCVIYIYSEVSFVHIIKFINDMCVISLFPSKHKSLGHVIMNNSIFSKNNIYCKQSVSIKKQNSQQESSCALSVILQNVFLS